MTGQSSLRRSIEQSVVPALSARDRFRLVIRYMEDNLGEKLTRQQLAGLLFLHPSYFNRAFKQVYGMSSIQMLRMLRLRRAVQLLEESDYTLEQIAAACGFGEANYFNKVFKERAGQTPGEYRNRINLNRSVNE
ncbi:helix-turn-helix domain-containing protein [Paenibacillus sp. NPDC058174]|uniref:helix-turn-helix domain-containing protein n=1 Tax=Paenibacillus sp. NPDC058174 TaxID=3346366 RepID=UPI0036DE86FB